MLSTQKLHFVFQFRLHICILIFTALNNYLSVSIYCDAVKVSLIPNLTHHRSLFNDTSECCSFTYRTDGAIAMQCYRRNICVYAIESTSDSTIKFEVIQASLNGTDYFYIENLDMKSINRYAAFSGNITAYTVNFDDTYLNLHVRADVSVILQDVQSGPIASHSWSVSQPDNIISNFRRLFRCPFKFVNDTNRNVTIKTMLCSMTCDAGCTCDLRIAHRVSTKCLEQRGSKFTESIENILIILPEHFDALNFSKSNLSSIENNILGTSFQGSQHLEWLYLFNNNLGTLKDHRIFASLSRLGHLDLSKNGLTYIGPGTFRELFQLEELFLDENNLTSLDIGMFRGLKELDTLHLCCNQLRTIENGVFQDVPRLEWLSLSDNNLVTIDAFYGIKLLQSLALQRNKIDRISDDFPDFLSNLTTLNLSVNRLRQLPMLRNLSRLNLLDLRNNPLTRVDKDTFNGLKSFTVILVDEHGTCCFIGTSSCNSTNPKPPYLTCKRMLPNLTLRVFMWILGWSALLGNLFVLCWRCIGKLEDDKVQSLLITNLALSDMLMGIYMLILVFADMHFERYFPSYAEVWRSGFTCKMAGVLAIASCESSIFFVTLISLDRFIRVVYPHTIHRLRNQSTNRICCALWVLALTLGIFPVAFVGRNDRVYDISEVCIGLPLVRKSVYTIEKSEYKPIEWFDVNQNISISTRSGSTTGMYFSITIFLGLNLVCFCIVLFCYLAILKAVRDTSKRVHLSSQRDREIKMAAKMFMIVGTDFLCWVPIIFTGILVQCGAIELSPVTFAWAVTFVLPINSSVNPYLYTIPTLISKRYGCRNPICHVSSSTECQLPGTRDNIATSRSTRAYSNVNSRQNGENMEMGERNEKL